MNEKLSPRQAIPKPSPESLPEEIKGKIRTLNGRDINWVYTKKLFKTDVASNDRLSMPKNQIDMSFLRGDEREFLSKKLGRVVPRIEVGLVGPMGEELKTSLKMWEMHNYNSERVNYVYNLVGNWYKGVVVKYDLKIGELVQIWSFRVGQDLWFALVRLPD